MRMCDICQLPIPAERLEALPNTTRCVEHSNVTAPVAFMDYSHKTAPSLVLADSQDAEQVRMAQRAYRRER